MVARSSAMPYAAKTPMHGAPRTARLSIAPSISSADARTLVPNLVGKQALVEVPYGVAVPGNNRQTPAGTFAV